MTNGTQLPRPQKGGGGPGGPVVLPMKDIRQVKFDRTLLIGQGVTIYEKTPFAGYIKQVTPHWPGGCRALVDIAVGHGVVQFCPPEGYLALDNATPTYPFNEEVKDGEEIWVDLRNRDGAQPHSITVTVSLERK